MCQIGGLRYSKGNDILVKAYQNIDYDELILVGPVDDRIKELEQCDKKITVTGFTEHPERYLKMCGSYANPARHEPFGINILEAMAAGIPPIVSKYCGAKEIVEKVNGGLIISPSVENIVKKIVWLDSDLKKKERVG